MQQINRDALIQRAAALFADGVCDRVLGWKKGDFAYDVTPGVFTCAEEMEKSFVFNDFSAANLSKYLIAECRKTQKKVLVYLKPCDCYSFNQLLTEHRFDRDKVYAIAVPCDGKADINKIKSLTSEEIGNVEFRDGKVLVKTLYDGEKTLDREDCLAQRCTECKSKKHVAYDELLGEDGEVCDNRRFDEVEQVEAMTPDERFDFWRSHLSRCIRCNACRDICPACTCEKCVFDNPVSGVENKAAANSFEENMFHIIRAFHVAGRCTDCGECSRVCPQHIPLHLLNRKFIKDINTLYGDYQAGEIAGSRAPLVDYSVDDAEPSEAVERGGKNA